MSSNHHSFEPLKKYLPEGTFDLVMPIILMHRVHLTVARERQTKLGDYRHALGSNNHRISVNGNLNKFSFLITLLHELAHLLAFQQYGHRIAPHGREWKNTYSGLLFTFLQHNIFPKDIQTALEESLHNPGASTCSEEGLQRVLKLYDPQKPGVFSVEQLPVGATFTIGKGRQFRRGEQLRKRIKCYEIPSNRVYLFNPLYEVVPL